MKILGLLQARFGNCPFDIIVAISNQGRIDRPENVDLPELVKADQVVDRVRETYQRHRKADSPLSLAALTSNDGIYRFNDNELDRLTHFLVRQHTPRYPSSDSPDLSASIPDSFREEPAPYGSASEPLPTLEPARPTSLGQCNKCGTQSMIQWGKYGYYWKCRQCDNNMPIKEICPACNKKMKLRKDGLSFYKRCEKCGTEEHYCVFEEAEG